ncbi:MAG: primosomal protein N' [Odoribacteraceae bacterium]|jgi:primosomal protein N' (replication factor Y)|nr:primosomal protein N' [Odoribacteraceae bacterium]
MFVDVIIPLAVEGFFTYSVPPRWQEVVREGSLVAVSFVGGKRYTGVVHRAREEAPAGIVVKPIDRVIEEGFALSATQLRFLLWMSDYYMACPGEVTRAALPVAMRVESRTCFTPGAPAPADEEIDEGERRVLQVMQPGKYLTVAEIEKLLGGRDPIPAIKTLLDRSLVTIKEEVDDLFKPKRERVVRWARPFSEEALHAWLDRLPPGQRALLGRWIDHVTRERLDSLPVASFRRLIGPSEAALKGLRDKGILQIVAEERSRVESGDTTARPLNVLSREQQRALEETRAWFNTRDAVLLHGVTSSGKTEVYMHLIRETLDRGRQALYLLPEIALTVQIVKRLRRHFGEHVGIYHSGMPDAARVETWRKQNGPDPFPVMLGARSALFLPYRDLGLVIVDEEHDPSYKQTAPAPRYHGRAAAVMLASFHGAKVLLGSATPSFESYRHATTGKYGLVRLLTRHGEVSMPRVVLADMADYRRRRLMDGIFTPPLRDEMARVLGAGEQVILFQNRRGYSSYLRCDRCGEIPRCKRCDVSLTYYKQQARLVCHYCGSIRPLPPACEACGEGNLVTRTPGTERVEEEVTRLFPGARVARLDMEAVSRGRSARSIIDRFEAGEIDVLVGTQMVSKGLDFERVKLVGVIDADALLSIPDFRVEERAYQLLVQVSGRSGRAGERGTVVIQAHDASNRIHEWIARGDYDAFYRVFAGERELFRYPPACRLIRVELRHAREETARRAANALADLLREELQQRLSGPAVPEVGRIRGEYRLHLLVKTDGIASLSRLKTFIKTSTAGLLSRPGFKSVRVIFDVDPH